MPDFYVIYEGVTILVIYHSVNNINDFLLKLNNCKIETCNIYIIYNYKEEIIYSNPSINLIYSVKNFSNFLNLHDLRMDPFTLRLSNIPQIIDNYDLLHNPNPPQNTAQREYSLSMIKNIKYSLLNKTKSEIIDTTEIYNQDRKEFCELINIKIPSLINYIDINEFLNSYTFEKRNNIVKVYKNTIHLLTNVYYMNKQWFNKDKKPINIEIFEKDFEYHYFKKTSQIQEASFDKSLENKLIQNISEEVIFLDYIYGWYNFGEFWDVLRRLIACGKKLPLFYSYNGKIGVLDLPFYFNTLGCELKYKCEKNKAYYFDKIYISVIEGGGRGFYNRFDAYQFNKIYNNISVSEKEYVLYLSRGKFGRSLINEEEIISNIKSIHPIIVINGSETREQIFHYFTNAKLIFGSHGSLMKNLIWCKKSPIFINICPYKRANGDMIGNSLHLGFQPLYFIVDCDDKQMIHLSSTQKSALYKIIKLCL